MAKGPVKILTWKDCSICNEMKENGMCEKIECVEVSTTEGQKIAKDLKIDSVPQGVGITKSGKFKKVNMDKIYEEFSN